MKILMVCLGNICRSPLAEGILQHKIKIAGLNWEVDSAGTAAWYVGNLPDLRSQKVAKKYGIDISYQRARKFKVEDFQTFDYIYVMDSSNYQDVRKLTQNETEKNKVELIMNESQPGYNENVPDPYWDDDGFEKVYKMLDKATDAILKNKSKKKPTEV